MCISLLLSFPFDFTSILILPLHYFICYCRFISLLHEICNKHISGAVTVDVSKDTVEMEETKDQTFEAVEVVLQKAAVEEGTELKMATAEEQPLKQASVVEEEQPEDFIEPFDTQPTTDEVHPADVVYDEILPQESITIDTLKTEECIAELFLQKPISPEEAEAEGFISLPKEETVELLQPLSTEEIYSEESVEPLATELITDEMHPTEVPYDEILSKESIAVQTVKIEECVAELSIQKPLSPEEAEAEGFISLPKEEKVELLQPSSMEDVHPEESVEPFETDLTTDEMHPTEVAYEEILPKESIAVETCKSEECVAEVSLQKPIAPEEAEAEGFISLPKEEKVELLQPSSVEEVYPEESVEPFETDLTTDEMHPTEVAYEGILSKESIAVQTVNIEECVAELSLQKPIYPEEAEAEGFISVPKEEKVELLQPLSMEEVHPEESVEPFETDLTTDEMHPTEVAYDEILPKESIVVETLKTEECIAEVSLQKPISPEEAEAEGFISLPKEEKVELLQPSSMKEVQPEESVESLATELITDEMRPSEVVYDEILSKESITVQTVKTEECIAEVSLQKSISPEEAEAEGFISLPKKEKLELLQPLSVEEVYPEESVEPFETDLTTDEIHSTEVVYDEILPKESIVVQTVKTEESVAELSIQQLTSPEEPEAEGSIFLPKEQKEAVEFELESAKPKDYASLDAIEPTKVEETLTVPSADVQQPAETKQAEIIKAPKPEVQEDVSLTLAKQPTSDDASVEESLKIPSPKSEEESVSLESKKPEPQTEEESLALILQQPSAEDESLSLSLQQPQEEEETDLTLSLKKPEDGMKPTAALACVPTCSMDQCA